MAENERRFRSLLVSPGLEIRQEGKVSSSPFGDGSEGPISAIMKELHIHSRGDELVFNLDSPIVGGPVVVCYENKQIILVPGEPIRVRSNDIMVATQKAGCIQLLLLD